jgi:hypothetical protein
MEGEARAPGEGLQPEVADAELPVSAGLLLMFAIGMGRRRDRLPLGDTQVFALDVHVALVLQALQRHGQMDPHGANLGGGTRRRHTAESLQ